MALLPVFSTTTTTTPSGSAGRRMMRDFFSNQNPPQSSTYIAPSVTPYLGLRARLSQIWINRWTVLLLLVLVRTMIAISGIDSDLGSARREALSACSSVESMGSAMASMPHYMSAGVNELTAAGMERSVDALMQTSTMAITAVEEIVVFVLHMMYGTYFCLITFAVTGSATAVLNTLDAAQKGLNDLTQNLGDDMAGILQTFQNALDEVKNHLGGAVLGTAAQVVFPSLDVSGDIDKLKNLQLPPGLADDIHKLQQSIPSFDQVQNLTDTVIRFPFEQVKQLVNGSLGNYSFDRSVFPVPAKQQMSFCSDDNGVNNFFDNLSNIAHVARKVFIGVLLVAAILACIPMTWREIRRWRTMKERSQLVKSHQHDPMDVVYIVSRPYTASAGLKLSNAVKTERRQTLVRWVVAYATTEPALFVLSLAVAGLFSCLCQFILLRQLEKQVPELTAQVAGFADKVTFALNNASTQWALGANKVITDTNTTINNDMFGWVNTTTTAVNNTLNTFVDLTTKVLNDTFGNTPLADPVQEIFKCLIGLKVAGIEKGLTWVHDNAHVNFPLLPNDIFSTGAVQSIASDSPPDESYLATPGDVASDKISSAVVRFINRIVDGLRTEAIISLVVLCIWLLIVLMGVARAMALWFGRDKTRGEGGAAPIHETAEPQAPNNDFRSDNQDRYQHPANHDQYQHPASRSVTTTAHVQHHDHGLPAYEKEPNVSIISDEHDEIHDEKGAGGPPPKNANWRDSWYGDNKI